MEDPQFYKSADGNYVHFEWVSHKNEAASREAGRPIFDKQMQVHVTSPGLTKTQFATWVKRVALDGKVTINDEYHQRYRQQVEAFERNDQGGKMEGTPLTELPFLDVHTRAMLKAQNVHTAEALAELSEAGIAGVGMGAREWKKQAEAWLEQAKGGAPITRLTAENERQQNEIEALKAQIADLAARLEKPKKVKEAA